MNIIAKKDILMDYLNVVQRAIPNKGLVQAMEGVYIKASEEGVLEIAATNGEFSIIANAVKCDTWEAGEIILPPKFINIVKLLPGEMVQIEATEEDAERCKINITSSDSSFTLSGIPGHLFPEIDQEDEGVHIQIAARDLKELLNNVLFAASPQNHNPIFEGVLLEVKDGKLYAIASDTYRVAIDTVSVDAESFKAIVPAKALAEVNKIITDPEEIVNSIVSTKNIKITYKDYIISAKLFAGKYPDLLSVFPKTYKTKAIVDTAKLKELIARVLLIDHKITIETNSHFHVSAVAQDGQMEETMDAEIDGEELKIFFNAHYIYDVLRVVGTEKVVIEFNGPLGPCIIRVPNSNFRYMALPIRQLR